MSSITEIPDTNESASYGPTYTSSAKETVAGPQPQRPGPTKRVTSTIHVSNLFTSSILNSVESTEQPPVQKKEITEEEAASILVLMRRTYAVTGPETRMGGPPSSRAGVTSITSSAIEPSKNQEKRGTRSTRKNEGTNHKNLAPVTRRGSSTVAVFVPRAKTKPKKAKVNETGNCRRNNYNVFRTKASKLLGTKVINGCREGNSFNGKIATLWKEVSEDGKTAFSDWTSAEQKAYLVKLAKGPQTTEENVDAAVAKKKEVKVATRIQPRRNVEGKTKK